MSPGESENERKNPPVKTQLIVLLLLIAGYGAHAASSEDQNPAAIGQPTIFWRNGEWQTYRDGIWSPYFQSQDGTGKPGDGIAHSGKAGDEAGPGVAARTEGGPGHERRHRPWHHPNPNDLAAGGTGVRKHWGQPGNGGSELAIGKPNVAIGQPNILIGQPNISIGQPNVAIGQPNLNIGQPNIAIGQPNVAIGQPNLNIGQPNVSIGKPNVAIGQPNVAIGQQNLAIGHNNLAIGQPNLTTGRPNAAAPHNAPGTKPPRWPGNQHADAAQHSTK